jgi:hypothetical protein
MRDDKENPRVTLLRVFGLLILLAAFGLAIAGVAGNATTYAELERQIGALNMSLAAQQATVSALAYDAAMNAAHSVTSNVTIVNSGLVRFFSTCQAGFRRGSPDFWQYYSSTKTWEDYEGKPEANFTVSQVTTSVNSTMWVVNINPPADPIVQDAANVYSGYSQECNLWIVSNQPAWISNMEFFFSEYPSLAPQSPTGVFNDPACTGSDCIMRTVT